MSDAPVLLVYESKRGSAQQAAQWIAEELGSCNIIDLNKNGIPRDISGYEAIIIGTGILAGKAYPKVRKFIQTHKSTLLAKDLYLFITHLEEGDGVEKDFETAFDKDILVHAKQRRGVGGRLRLQKLNFILRKIIKTIGEKAGRDFTDYDTLSQDACREFARSVRGKYYW
jgi:menaquinone-dependent protoporphyrinogen oxidase